MKRVVMKIVFLLFGGGAFAYFIAQFGVEQLLLNVEKAGIGLVYIFFVWLIIYLLNTAAWKFVLGDDVEKVSFSQMFMITVSGFVLNYVTPVIALGGEPYKVNALAQSIGASKALSAVVLYRMVHLLGHMFLLLFGLLITLATVPLPISLFWSLLATAAILVFIIYVILAGHRNGVFGKIQHWFGRHRLFSGVSRALERESEKLEEMDRVLMYAYQHQRLKFYGSVVLEVVSRIFMGLEVYIILQSVGIAIPFLEALFVYVVYSIIINLLFFIPLNLGAREGGLALGLQSLTIAAPILGVYLGVVMRIREFCWILIGLSFIPFTGSRKNKAIA